jgi:hypothetical protein
MIVLNLQQITKFAVNHFLVRQQITYLDISAQNVTSLTSPDITITVEIGLKEKIYYTLSFRGNVCLKHRY